MHDALLALVALLICIGVLAIASFIGTLIGWSLLYALRPGAIPRPTYQSLRFAAKFSASLVLLSSLMLLPAAATHSAEMDNPLLIAGLLCGIVGLIGGKCLQFALTNQD